MPDQYASMIPGIAYTVPDLGGQGKLQLFTGDHQPVACVQSTVGNGKTMNVPAVKYVAAGVAGAALVMSGVSALSGAGKAGSSTSSPTFTEVMHWFQGIAMNGMLSVQYPGIYRSFSANFGFSTGLVPWNSMQTTIDNFRASTGGNLTHDNVQYLRNSTLVYGDDPNQSGVQRRALSSAFNTALLYGRDVDTSVNGSSTTTGAGSESSGSPAAPQDIHSVKGMAAYAETLMVPESNTFMNVLLIFAIVLASITCGILLFKVILEAWALFASFPKKLEGFRKRYWWTLAKTITNLILVLYGVWTLYCVYMFKDEKSGWAAKLLAGLTLGLFTGILIGFTVKIWLKARKARKMEGDASALYEDKEVWVKYSIFYDNYKKSYWWIFVPVIVYMFAKGCVIAGGEGNGMFQCAGQLVVDSLLLLLLLFLRPYSLKSGNWINIVIQVVRVLSVICILVFVEELGISQTTQTITGVVLIVMQAVLTAVLAILIAVNALINCCKMNPHRKARKEAGKSSLRNRSVTNKMVPNARAAQEKLDDDEDPHNSWLMNSMEQKKQSIVDVTSLHSRNRSSKGYNAVSSQEDLDRPLAHRGAGMGYGNHDRTPSEGPDEWMEHNRRQPQLPDLDYNPRQPQLPNLEYRGRGIGSAM